MSQKSQKPPPPPPPPLPAQAAPAGGPRAGLFRAEAIAHRARAHEEGSPLVIDRTWMMWAYRLVVLAGALGLLFVCFGTVHEYATGHAIVRVDGRRTITAAFAGTVDTVEAQPGRHVKQGEVLVRLRDTEQAAEYQRIATEFDLQLVRLLRDPTDLGARQTLTTLKVQRDLAKTMLDERVIRASIAGVLSDIRIRQGQHLSPGDAIISISPEDAPVTLLAVVPGEYRPMIKQGANIRFSLDGYRYEYHDLEVESVGEEVIGPSEIRRFFGQEQFDTVQMPQGAQVLVRAKIPQRNFTSEGETYGFFDGLTGTAEVRVRREPIVVTLLPVLKSVFP